ncbi:SDR family NAD(P)-dependent oxidoreductase [Arthrobacter sp. NPDC097144]|uniref:SDR family NAD(P)-dependent oxidoreductase n=1 Tax=Arthrobacter sp. NPDC097144 TaxID=3363946 RepID=UPI0038020401
MSGFEKYGPWALIAGGSEGVGAALAHRLAEQGLNVAIVARKPGPLAEVAESVRSAYGVEVLAIEQDLLAPGAVASIAEQLGDREVGLLVSNAGANTYGGEIVTSDADRAQMVIDLNITVTLELIRRFGAPMQERQRGGILLTGSLSGFAGTAGIGFYSAAKAFVHNLAEALWVEMRPYGVDVLELCLGLTRTPAMERLGFSFDAPGVRASDPDTVAREGLEHLTDGPSWIVDGFAGDAETRSAFPRRPVVEAANTHYRSPAPVA